MAGPNGELMVAGQYVVTWNGLSAGIMEGEASVPTIAQAPKSKPVNSTDKYGGTKIESSHLGVDYQAEFVCLEYPLGIPIFWPFGAFGLLGVIGTFKSLLAKPLVLTVVAGTPAVGSPNTITAARSIIADDFQGKLMFGPMVRTVPIRLDLLPYDTTGGKVFGSFTQT